MKKNIHTPENPLMFGYYNTALKEAMKNFYSPENQYRIQYMKDKSYEVLDYFGVPVEKQRWYVFEYVTTMIDELIRDKYITDPTKTREELKDYATELILDYFNIPEDIREDLIKNMYSNEIICELVRKKLI
jgi:hypothetical protein